MSYLVINMNAEMVTRTIQLILAPVLLVSASALLVSGLLGHYASISSRLRALNYERLEIIRNSQVPAANAYTRERLMEIDHQLPDLLRRHKLVRNAALGTYCAVFLFLADMVVIAVAVAIDSNRAASAALGTFLAGLLALSFAMLMMTIEVRYSHQALDYEVKRVIGLTGPSGASQPALSQPVHPRKTS